MPAQKYIVDNQLVLCIASLERSLYIPGVLKLRNRINQPLQISSSRGPYKLFLSFYVRHLLLSYVCLKLLSL